MSSRKNREQCWRDGRRKRADGGIEGAAARVKQKRTCRSQAVKKRREKDNRKKIWTETRGS